MSVSAAPGASAEPMVTPNMAPNPGRLAGKVAIVTGSSKGIGRAIALAFATAGVQVVGVSRGDSSDPDGGPATLVARVAGLAGSYTHVSGDVGKEVTARDSVECAMSLHGKIDMLVNNAGTGLYADFTDSNADVYDQIMNTNMRSTFLFTSHVVPVMKAAHAGLILQISSLAGLRGFPRESIYCASKHAQVGFTRALRQELQPFGIKVGVICPAGVATEFALGTGRTQEFIDNAGFLAAEDVADAVLFAACQPPYARVTELGLISMNEPL